MQAFAATSDAARIALRRSGSGPALVLLSNWSFSSAVFHHQQQYFSRSYTVYQIDARGHGASPPHRSGNDYATHAADLAAVLEHFALTKVHLVAWYAGAVTALAYCETYGTGRVASLTGIDLGPRPMFDNVTAWALGPLARIVEQWQLLMRSEATRRQFLNFFIDNFMIDRKLADDEREWLIREASSASFETSRVLFADLMLRNYRTTLTRVAAELPVMAVHARHWGKTPYWDIAAIAPQVTFAGYGGHMMFWEYHERFNRELEAFLVAADRAAAAGQP